MELKMIANPEILEIADKKLAGIRIMTTLSANKTFELWGRFMPRLKEVEQKIEGTLYSVRKYPLSFGTEAFTFDTEFEEWAAIEVITHDRLPSGLEKLSISAGKYAVFNYVGLASDFPATAQFIYMTWIPGSGYTLDDREHFAVMGKKYLPNDPSSEEEIWVPIK
jgi:AraC family transcriptional regulator